jgi:hypothetical protein
MIFAPNFHAHLFASPLNKYHEIASFVTEELRILKILKLWK